VTSEDTQLAALLARQAGQLLLSLRAAHPADGDAGELRKAGDSQSNTLLLKALAEGRPDDAVLSEEAADDLRRLEADRVWIIDPLDGTREFGMAGRSDWAVHVALWERGHEITAAAVAQPALDRVFATDGSLHPAGPTTDGPIILVSDSRPPVFAAEIATAVGGRIQPMGSAGAKAMAVLRGEADAYVHAGGQWEWDSAAPVGVLLAAGLHASRLDGSPLLYNQPRPYLPDLVMCRPDLAEPILSALAELATDE
jgi:3'(2'), 5'-bisphosphate nucleotidase